MQTPSQTLRKLFYCTLPLGLLAVGLLLGLRERIPLAQAQSRSVTLRNISTRGVVGMGDEVLIGGFIIEGSTPKTVVVRALGPTLTNFRVPGALVNPTVELVNRQGTLLDTNDDWGSHGRQGELQANPFPGPPPDTREAAVVATLNPGGVYGDRPWSRGATGVALVEVYWTRPPLPQRHAQTSLGHGMRRRMSP